MLTKSNVPLREEVCSTGSWRFCLPRINFWLDQRPECCLYSLGFVWFYIQLLSSPVHRNWEDQSGLPIVCPVTMVYFSFLHGPPAVFVWKSHHNLFHTFFLPWNFWFSGFFCVLLFLPLNSDVFWLPNQVSPILIPCLSAEPWMPIQMPAHPSHATQTLLVQTKP